MTQNEYNKYVDLYSDNIYRFALKNLGDIQRSEDIVQDTFMKFWEKRDKVDRTKAKSYLFTTAYHTIIDYVRKDKKHQEIGDVVATTSNGYNDLQEILHNAINKLPADQKAVILLRDYEGYSYREIASITEMSESQVKVYIFRGRKFLKEYLGSLEQVI